MRVHVVSDVHGAAETLARAGDGADALVVLGDLIDYVDYHDPRGAILGRVLGPEVSERFARLRSTGAPGELAAFAQRMWDRFDDPVAVVADAVREQYTALFAVLTAPTWVIPGNVDVPQLWPEFARPGLHFPDGRVCELDGLRFGFVGGVPLPPGVARRPDGPWQAHMIVAAEYTAAVEGLGAMDVLCSHVPPAVPELSYDLVTRRPEIASTALLDAIAAHRPRRSMFGHVHQPLSSRVRLGRTECVNVGHFRRTGAPYVLRW